MNVIDIIIILCLISAGISGSVNGFFKQSVVLIGTIIAFILSWVFKNPIADFLSYNLPFFSFLGPFEGLTSLNIILYQLIAFMVLLCLFFSVLIILIRITGIFEKVLKMTIFLGIPSKILGFVVGIIEGYIIIFAVLFFLNQPTFNIKVFNDSALVNPIVNSSPGLSNIVGNMNDSIKDVYYITKDYEVNKNVSKTNKQITNSLLKHKVINEEYLNKLREKNKINY